MNFNFKSILFPAVIIPLIISCNNDSNAKTSNTDSTTVKTEENHEHLFACPMHPEVTGKEGDTCPKCGMKLEHMDAAPDAAGTYFMQFSTNPSSIEANKEVMLSLIPKKKNADNEQVALDIEHEKKIHLIVASEDLSYFDHIHPEYGSNGAYTVNTKFPVGGKIFLFADYKPTGGSHVVDKLTVNVNGGTVTNTLFSADKWSATVDGYTVSLTPEGGKFVTNTPMHIAGLVSKAGKEVDVNTLENYLGAKAHMVIISRNDQEYLHVHPGVEGGKFDMHTSFTKPGIYRGWIQFQTGGKIHTADFVFNVKEGAAGVNVVTNKDEHGGH